MRKTGSLTSELQLSAKRKVEVRTEICDHEKVLRFCSIPVSHRMSMSKKRRKFTEAGRRIPSAPFAERRCIEMEYIKLDNGLNLFFHPMLNTHSVTIGLYIKAGSGYESKDEKGITHFLEHLHFRRSGSLSQEALYYKMESIGSDLRGKTYCDFLKYSMKILPNKIEDGLVIFENIMNADEWTDVEVDKERQVVINQMKEKGNYIYIEDEVRKCVFRNSPVSNEIMGTMETIQRLQGSDIKEYKKQIFNKNNMVLCITGCVGNTEWALVQKRLGNLKLSEGAEKRDLMVPQVFHCRKPDVVFRLTEDSILDVNVSFDISGCEQTNEFLTILNCILGEGTGSNIQKKLRENLGYTSDIYSYVEKYKGFAVLHIRFSVEKKLLLHCLNEIVGIIQNLKENITHEELDVCLPFYTSNKVFLEDDTVEMNFQLAYQNFILGSGNEKEVLENNRETIDVLQNLAKLIFKPENASIVIIGNVNKISKKSIRGIMNGLESYSCLEAP